MQWLVNKTPPWGPGPLRWIWEIEKLALLVLTAVAVISVLIVLLVKL
jgi:hypothetical protein